MKQCVKLPTSSQVDKWIESNYDVIKTNISGCKYWSKKGFPDCHIKGIGFIEKKRGHESFKPGQLFWLERLDGQVWRFWHNRVDIYGCKQGFINTISIEEY